jgi:hypothetical protein
MSTLFLLFNHQLTPLQESDAQASLGAERIVPLPPELQELWGNIPPGLLELRSYLEPLRTWLGTQTQIGDYVLIQGDFGACWLMVNFAFDQGLVPVYSTTRREAEEEHNPEGKVRLTHHFQHQIFRRYGV